MTILSAIPRTAVCAVAVVLTGCQITGLTDQSSTIAGVYLGIGYQGFTSDVFLTLGTKDSLQAQAFSGGWPSRTIYDSFHDPTRFHYRSTRPDVATVDSVGNVTTVSVGETSLVASVGTILSPAIRVSVSPAANALVAEPVKVTARVGDDFSVAIDALDSTGRSAPGVIFNVGSDTTAWAVTSEPAEGNWKLHTPTVLHFKAKIAGSVRLIATVQNERTESRFQVIVPVVVQP